MNKIDTHYDNLKVTRDAPPEVIRAAYRVLSKKYHPDKHKQDPEYVRIMASINASYDVLNNPQRKAEYDAWLDAQKLQGVQEHKESEEENREQVLQSEEDDFLSDFHFEEYEDIWKIYESHLLSISKSARILVLIFGLILLLVFVFFAFFIIFYVIG